MDGGEGYWWPMATRGISAFPDTVLRKRTESVKEITPDVLCLIEDMIETMYGNGGVGLAAPQVGVSLRVAVVDTSLGTDPDAFLPLGDRACRQASESPQPGATGASPRAPSPASGSGLPRGSRDR